MTTPAPIYDSITKLRYAVVAAMKPLTTRPIYWQEAPSNAARPFVVAQSQDHGGSSSRAVGELGWVGIVVVKAIADTLSSAEQLLLAVSPGMEHLTSEGMILTTVYDHPVVIAPLDAVWQTANQWQVSMYRAPSGL